MSREGRRALVATVALLAAVTLATAATFALRRPGRTAAPATITANDPTWCGRPLASGGPGELGDPAACGKLSFTGTAPECVFWAECREERFEIDCVSAGPGRCRCDRDDTRAVVYDPTFCTLDASHAQQSLRAILDAASIACRWRSR